MAEVIKAKAPGVIVEVNVKPGDAVTKGQKVIVMEAMKMKMSLMPKEDGVVESVSVEAGARVNPGEVLVTIS